MKLFFETLINLPFEDVRAQFNSKLFSALSRGIIPFKIERFDGCKKGDEIHIRVGLWPLEFKWVSIITFEETNAAGWSFIDEGKVLPWPLSHWHHHHRVDSITATESKIVDDIEYKCSPVFLGQLIRPLMWILFSVRPKRYRKFFEE